MPDAVKASAAPGPLEPVLLAGSVNLLAGTSGVGKTAFLAFLAKQLSHQSPVFGVPPSLQQPPYQAYIGTNRSWVHSSSKWFNLEGLGHLKHYSLVDDKPFKKRRMKGKADRLAVLTECLARVSPNGKSFPPGSLVYVDSLALFLGGNLLDSDATAVALLEVRELCQDLGDVALIGTMDASKPKSDKKQGYARLQDHILGSTSLYTYSDTQMFLASPEELGKKTYTFLWAPHHCKSKTFSLSRDDAGRFLSEETTAEVAASWIVGALRRADGGVLQFVDLFKQAVERDLSRKTLQRQLDAEVSSGRVRKVGHGKYGLAPTQ